MGLGFPDRVHLLRRIGAAVLYIDGKIGTEEGAQSAVDTVGIIDEFRRVIAFGIGSF
jgi:hypothetical protein